MKPKGRIRITDIANELGITASTVSRALNGNDRIGKKTTKAVLDLAKEWGYRPNHMARSLLSKKTKTIGLVIPEFNHNFFSVMLEGIESVTTEHGYRLIIATSDAVYEKEKEACLTLTDAYVDGLLISLSHDHQNFDHLIDIQDHGTSIVFMDRICEDLDAFSVITDDFTGAFEAVDYLISRGCQKIAHIQGPEGISTTFNRYMGYAEALKKHGIPIDPRLIIKDATRAHNSKTLPEILPEIDGIFAFSDYFAFNAVEQIKEIGGYNIPTDISVIGYADEPIARYMSPKLTTIKQPSFEMGRTAALTLLKNMELTEKGEAEMIHTVSLKTSLVVRESVK